MSVRRAETLGIYISIPFCRSKCTYCNFASGVYPAGKHARYVDRLVEDLEASPAWADAFHVELPRRVDTIYLGGGTPSLLSPELVTRLFQAIRNTFAVDTHAEITMECAPGQLADATLQAMVSAGVNRVSLGVQSFVDREAHASGRLHDRKMVENDLRRLRAAGITNLNVDLIAGLAGQTLQTWEDSLDALMQSQVPHASIYMLEVDEDSRLGRELMRGGARYSAGLVPSDDAIAAMYESGVAVLAEAGIEQYEISNFAREGFASRHNMRYWQRQPYLGLGLDASSALGAGDDTDYVARMSVSDDLKEYLAGGQQPEVAWLDADRRHEEAWFLGLRMNEGVDAEQIREEFGRERTVRALEVVQRLVQEGLMSRSGNKVFLTARGRMISNDIFQEFLGLATSRG